MHLYSPVYCNIFANMIVMTNVDGSDSAPSVYKSIVELGVLSINLTCFLYDYCKSQFS